MVFDMLRELDKLLATKLLVSVQQWIFVFVRVKVDDTRFWDFALQEFIRVKYCIFLPLTELGKNKELLTTIFS